MKPLVLPFDYLPVDKACKWITSYIAPFSVAPDDVYLLWQQNKISLCLDWGDWYWPGVIIDLGGTRDRVHRGHSPWLPFKLSSGSNAPHDDEERDESVERITRIIDALEGRTSKFVMPEYHSFKLAWKPVRGPDFPGGEKYADPIRGLLVKPYGINCEYFRVNIPLKNPKCWVGEGVNKVHPNWAYYKNCGLWGNYQGFEMEDLVIPAEEMRKIIALYKPEQEFSDSTNKISEAKAEHHAKNQRQIFMSAVRVLVLHTDACRDAKTGEFTPAMIYNAMCHHQKEYGQLALTDSGTVKKLIKDAIDAEYALTVNYSSTNKNK